MPPAGAARRRRSCSGWASLRSGSRAETASSAASYSAAQGSSPQITQPRDAPFDTLQMMLKRMVICVVGLGIAVLGCTKEVNRCKLDSDCADVAYPFCDAQGEYPSSAGVSGVCTVIPVDCPVERCGCEPHASSCTGDLLRVCNEDGRSTTDTSCSLGCSPTSARCATFTPSNGLDGALAMAAFADDVELDSVAFTDDGKARDLAHQGAILPITSILVPQGLAPPLRVFIAHSFKIHAGQAYPVSLSFGSNPMAFVSVGPIVIDGTFDAGDPPGRQVHTFGLGSQNSSAPCAGTGGGYGGGGGGNATKGGDGAAYDGIGTPTPASPGGAAQSAQFEPLVGGCPGGDYSDQFAGGHGGSAIEFVSATSINISSTGRVNVGGQGGSDKAGGGSGGTLVFQSPLVDIAGLVAANGGSGGACSLYGSDGPTSSEPAASVGGCGPGTHSGAGGTATVPPGSGSSPLLGAAGGGGAVGHVLIESADGSYGAGTISAGVTARPLERN